MGSPTLPEPAETDVKKPQRLKSHTPWPKGATLHTAAASRSQTIRNDDNDKIHVSYTNFFTILFPGNLTVLTYQRHDKEQSGERI